MIVKNEEKNLLRCLTSVRPFVDELIVVDTGSTDGTIALAREAGVEVKHFTWCDDFAAARNFALDQSSGDWVLTLDADEELVVEGENWRDRLTNDPAILAYWLPLYDTGQPLTAMQFPRLFRRLPELRYEGRYHEQLQYQQQALAPHQSSGLEGVKLLHYGYAPDILLTKNLQRDIPMLERIRARESLSLLLLMTLADAYLRTGQEDRARSCWGEAFDRIIPDLLAGQKPQGAARLPALLFTLGSELLHQQQDHETALLLCRRGLEWFPTYPPLNHLTGLLLREMGLPLGATAYFERCLQLGQQGTYYTAEPFDRNFMTVWAAHELGLTYLVLGAIPQAIHFLELALAFDATYEPALRDLALAKQQH